MGITCKSTAGLVRTGYEVSAMKRTPRKRSRCDTGARGAGLFLGCNLGSLTYYVGLSDKTKLVSQTFVLRTYIVLRRGAVVIDAHRAGVKECASSVWQYIAHAYAQLLGRIC